MLPERPWDASHWSMWALSPLGQDLVFLGFLYGWLERSFPGRVHRRLPVATALVLTAGFFALWHVPNVAYGLTPGYVAFQVLYTFVGCVVVGLSRQWTGSLLYATVTHSAINFAAWATP